MGLQALVQLVGLITVSFLTASLAIWMVAKLSFKVHPTENLLTPIFDDAVVFLFEDQNLISATGPARQIIRSPVKSRDDWGCFHRAMGPQYPDIRERMEKLPSQGSFVLHSQDGSGQIKARWQDGITRITLLDHIEPDGAIASDAAHLQAMQTEIDTLRATAESAPFLVWRQDRNGEITWANNSYLKLAQSDPGDGVVPTWPPANLFDLTGDHRSSEATKSRRVTAHIAGESEQRWFECLETPIGEELLFTAFAADKVVKAEIALRDFVQTLTKTFAHLTVGLAIFDKKRRLTLFNPALTELTSLSPSFLSGRPSLQTVLDQLREKQMVPEPKDYKSWSRQLFDLEVEAVNGTYEENWPLTNGSTYRVTGRPYPDGAVAFMFEDISAEISSARRFRAEQEINQAALDNISDAIAVFSVTGALLLSNNAYGELWNINTTAVIEDHNIVSASRIWADKCAPSPIWGDAREFVASPSERAEWKAAVQLRDGRALQCKFTPISGGATLAGFSVSTARELQIPSNLAPVQQLDADITAL